MCQMTEAERVVLVPSDHARWKSKFEQMAVQLGAILPGLDVEHIGSTSVPGVPAKDVVDLMIGVEGSDIPTIAEALGAAGWDLEGSQGHHCWLSWPHRSERQFIAHVIDRRTSTWQRRIDFRDLLRTDPSAVNEYLQVKLAAAATSENWDEYTQAKTDVVSRLLDSYQDRRHQV